MCAFSVHVDSIRFEFANARRTSRIVKRGDYIALRNLVCHFEGENASLSPQTVCALQLCARFDGGVASRMSGLSFRRRHPVGSRDENKLALTCRLRRVDMYNERTRRDSGDFFFIFPRHAAVFVLIKQFQFYTRDGLAAKGQTVQERDLYRGRIKSIRIFCNATLYALSLVINSFHAVAENISR